VPELVERYERLRDQALGGRTVTLEMLTLLEHGMSAWIEAFAARASTARGLRADADARPYTSAPRPAELIGLLATLVSNRKTTEVHA
jgi:hypothetical protein